MSLSEVESMLARVTQAYSAGTSCKWAVAMQDDDQMVGTCGFNEWSRAHGWAELAYELARGPAENPFRSEARKMVPYVRNDTKT